MCIVCETEENIGLQIMVDGINEKKIDLCENISGNLHVRECRHLQEISQKNEMDHLTITQCTFLTDISLGSRIGTLVVFHCESITTIYLPEQLKSFKIIGCSLLEKIKTGSDKSILDKIEIKRCGGIINLPEADSLPLLTTLQINDTPLISSVPRYPALKSLDLNMCKGITCIENYEELRDLVCHSLQNLVDIKRMKNLKSMACSYCPNLQSIPEFPYLKSLSFFNLKIKKIPLLQNLKYLTLESCKYIISIDSLPNLDDIDGKECYNLVEISNMPMLTCISFTNCTSLTSIHSLALLDHLFLDNSPVNLEQLSSTCPRLITVNCKNTKDIVTVPAFPNLKLLSLSSLPNLKQIGLSKNLTNLIIDKCPRLEEIPFIRKLQSISCLNCLSISIIPKLSNLHDLNCKNTSVTEIPILRSLCTLRATDCDNLVRIHPGNKNLYSIKTSRSRNLAVIPDMSVINEFKYDGCVLVEAEVLGKKNIESLKLLQSWARKCILRYGLKRIATQIAPIYYHPEMKGGWLAKRELNRFVEGINLN
jgi:hypothetical protein